jgi:hypothetical protein
MSTRPKRDPLWFPTQLDNSTTVEVRWPPRVMSRVELWVGNQLALLNSEEAQRLSKELKFYAKALRKNGD